MPGPGGGLSQLRDRARVRHRRRRADEACVPQPLFDAAEVFSRAGLSGATAKHRGDASRLAATQRCRRRKRGRLKLEPASRS